MKKYDIKTMEKFKLNAVGADASVRLRKNQNRNNIITFDKHKSNVVGVGVPDDPQSKYKYINKPMSNEISKYYNTFLKIEKNNKTGRPKDAQPIQVIKSNFGITLIALIITIIVLLILAGVTINMLIGDNGILNKATIASEKTKIENAKEIIKTAVLENEIYRKTGDAENTKEEKELQEEIEEKLKNEGYIVKDGKIKIGKQEIDIAKEIKEASTTEPDKGDDNSKDDDKQEDNKEIYYKSIEISNVSPYGYDVYIYGVSEDVNKIKYPTWTETNGKDDLISYETSKIQDGIYYGRVNLHNQEAGKYITQLVFYDKSGNTVDTKEKETIMPEKNKNVTNIVAESLVAGVRDNNIPTGYCDMSVNGKTYNLEIINIDEFYKYNQEKSQYEVRDFIAGTYNVSRTAVIKCKGNLQIDGAVTTSVGNIDGNNSLTKVKGLFICVNETLINNGTISMTARGTYNTSGEDIYLWKNSDGNYEMVPATGASGGSSVSVSAKGTNSSGNNGMNGTTRKTGGGGSGAVAKSTTASGSWAVNSGAGSTGTSYSGGSGGGRLSC